MIRRVAKAHGLRVRDVSLARRTVVLSGTVAQLNQFFKVDLGLYASRTETGGDDVYRSGVYRGREGSVSLPKTIAHLVEGVFGLDNRRMLRRHTQGAPAGAMPLTPPQVADLYQFPHVGNGGAGQTIAIIEYGGGYVVRKRRLPDIEAFFQSIGRTRPTITSVSVDGAVNSPYALDSLEVALDIDVAGSIAPNANIVVYFAPDTTQGMIDAIGTAVHDAVNRPSVVSISWGAEEFDQNQVPVWNTSVVTALSEIYREAAAMGVTICASSGDDGAKCRPNDGSLNVQYPASDPWVTGCGGTIITNVTGASFDEGTWNDRVWIGEPYNPYTGGATGGGFSRVFPRPSWQTIGHKGGRGRAGRPSKPTSRGLTRGVPDVAGNASDYSGYTYFCFGRSFTQAGTSAVAPLYAGFFALMNAELGFNLGYLNPTLYQWHRLNPSVFRDIADGRTNSVPYLNDSATPPTVENSPGYVSGPGWDPCTGLGVINGAAFLQIFRPAGP